MKIYTKTGDDGTTALFGGKRVRKSHPRLEVYGTVDELNSVIGFARSLGVPSTVEKVLEGIQHDLFRLGAEIASVNRALLSPGTCIEAQDIERLEKAIDLFDRRLTPLRNFILPGGCSSAAAVHIARTVCRRAERHLIRLIAEEPASLLTVIYLNRLSDLLFTIARLINQSKKVEETQWSARRPGTSAKKTKKRPG